MPPRRPRARSLLVLALATATACQAGFTTRPRVTAAPPLVTGLPVFLTPEPTIQAIEDAEARPLAIALQHDLRDILEEAGFKLAPSAEAASGVMVTLSIQKLSVIHADLFVHGAQACGVKLEIMHGASLLAFAEPDVLCVSTSAYYGELSPDAAAAMVNRVSRAPALLAVARSIRATPPPALPAPPAPPAAPASTAPPEPAPRPALPGR